MTNAERIVAELRLHGPQTDAELRQWTGIDPHQQVNQICRRLEGKGVLRRRVGPAGHIVNELLRSGDQPVRTAPDQRPAPQQSGAPLLQQTSTTRPADTISLDGALIVLPCSGRKASGGEQHLDGPTIVACLAGDLGDDLSAARNALRSRAHVDESRLLPAWQRYVGTLYAAAAGALRSPDVRQRTVIISGGYGLARADEPIGTYDRRFSLGDWRTGLLERCVAEVASASDVDRVIAFAAGTTGYAELVRRTARREGRLKAWLVSPDVEGRGGAQVLVPRAIGQAVLAARGGSLDAAWRSSDRIGVRIEALS